MEEVRERVARLEERVKNLEEQVNGLETLMNKLLERLDGVSREVVEHNTLLRVVREEVEKARRKHDRTFWLMVATLVTLISYLFKTALG